MGGGARGQEGGRHLFLVNEKRPLLVHIEIWICEGPMYRLDGVLNHINHVPPAGLLTELYN